MPEEIKTHINQAEKQLKKCQKDSQGLRYSCYQDLLAKYANDESPSTLAESKRKFRIVNNTIKSEQCREMYKNIRNRILTPRHKDSSTDPPSDIQALLTQTAEADIRWEVLLDKSSIETNLTRFNRNHFRAPSASPCGKGVIHSHLTVTSLSPHAKEMLKGNIPQTWYGNDALLREFLTSFKIPDRVTEMDPVPILLTNDDVKHGFGRWKESTSTSPSGQHLGHYKAIIQDNLLLDNLTKFMQIVVESGLALTRWGCNAVNIMIEKDPGQPKITRLRIIH